jgi:sulfatase modifying factor 1
VTFGVVACIDAPQIDTDVASSGGAPDPSSAGGASAVSRERDGMVLVPAATFDVTSGVSTTAVTPQAKDEGDQQGNNGNGKGKKPPKGGGGAAPDAGAGGDGGGSPPSGGGAPPVDAGAPPSGGGGTPAPSATQVAVPAFWLDAVEVTVASYRGCLASGACTAPAVGAGCTLAAGLEAHPVNCVTADQARAFCTWNAKRLVRNDEWTAATSGDARRVYPWGAEPPAADRLNACGLECAAASMYTTSDGYVSTAPAGSFPLGRSPEGALDLAGNVAEWVEGALAPTARGGSYADVAAVAVTSSSLVANAAPGPTVGFRCAADR